MTNPDINDSKAIHPQLDQIKNETLAILWTGYLIDATAEIDHDFNNEYEQFMLGRMRREMTRCIQARLDSLFAKDMNKFLEVINFLIDIEKTS